MKKRILSSRITLVVLGVALGMLARMVLGVPDSEMEPSRTIDRPMGTATETSLELPLKDRIRNKNDVNRNLKDDPDNQDAELKHDFNEKEVSGLVPPILIPGSISAIVAATQLDNPLDADSDFSHDSNALFEPHGHKVCASGCSASHHPTEKLTRSDFFRLLDEVTIEPMDRTNNALEALMYYGPQTRKWMESAGIGTLDRERAEFIWEEIKITHAKLAIRVTDENGKVRTWLDATRVPFDRRHVFDMKTNDVQPLVMSGTVKRVGLDHIWVRL